MIGFGILLIFAGLGSYLYGDNLNNDIEARLNSLFDEGQTDPGSTFITIGIVIGVVGLILLIAGIVRNINDKDSTYSKPEQSHVENNYPKSDQETMENRLITLKNLHDSGVITDEEYEAKKKQILML